MYTITFDKYEGKFHKELNYDLVLTVQPDVMEAIGGDARSRILTAIYYTWKHIGCRENTPSNVFSLDARMFEGDITSKLFQEEIHEAMVFVMYGCGLPIPEDRQAALAVALAKDQARKDAMEARRRELVAGGGDERWEADVHDALVERMIAEDRYGW